MFCRFKDWKRIATRYDRRADNFLAPIALVAIVTFWG
jgi:transposase